MKCVLNPGATPHVRHTWTTDTDNNSMFHSCAKKRMKLTHPYDAAHPWAHQIIQYCITRTPYFLERMILRLAEKCVCVAASGKKRRCDSSPSPPPSPVLSERHLVTILRNAEILRRCEQFKRTCRDGGCIDGIQTGRTVQQWYVGYLPTNTLRTWEAMVLHQTWRDWSTHELRSVRALHQKRRDWFSHVETYGFTLAKQSRNPAKYCPQDLSDTLGTILEKHASGPRSPSVATVQASWEEFAEKRNDELRGQMRATRGANANLFSRVSFGDFSVDDALGQVAKYQKGRRAEPGRILL